MKSYRTFSEALRADIEERFGGGATFTTFDFYPLADSFGKQHKSVTHTLREMQGKGLLNMISQHANTHGGGKIKCYAIVPGAQIKLKTPRDYQIEAAQKAHDTNLASIQLHTILDRITRARMAT